MLLKRTSQARYKYMAIFGELVPSWLYSQLQAIDPITSVQVEILSFFLSFILYPIFLASYWLKGEYGGHDVELI